MVTCITNGILVAVKTAYMRELSVPNESDFTFAYIISITNNSDYTVQLLRRFWKVFDSCNDYKFVDAEGVIGIQPVLEPGQTHTYNSGCNLLSDVGYMQGYYTFERLVDHNKFKVEIPRFELIVPEKLN